MKPRSIVGVLTLLAGLACYGAAGYVVFEAIEARDGNEDALRRTEVACREQLVKLGRVQPRENNAIEVDFGEVRGDPRRLLGDVTAALAMCPNRHLVDSCLGVGCPSSNAPPGAVRMTVKLGLGPGQAR